MKKKYGFDNFVATHIKSPLEARPYTRRASILVSYGYLDKCPRSLR